MYSKTYNVERIATLVESFQKSILIFDGAMGTELYRNHVFTNTCYDETSLTRAELVQQIHASYLNAGADVLTTNTIGADFLSLQKYGLAEKTTAINEAGVRLARQAIVEFQEQNPRFSEKTFLIAGSVGGHPTLEEELHEVGKRDAEIEVHAIAEHGRILLENGVDFLFFETLSTLEAAENCLRAVLEIQTARNEEIPFMLSFRASNVEGQETILILNRLVEKVKQENYPRPFAWGLNCGLGPDEILGLVEEVVTSFNVPWIIQPNAGSPRQVENRTMSMTSPEFYREYVQRYIALGAKGVGGCCGIGPEFIAEMAKAVKPINRARLGEIRLREEKEGVQPDEPTPLAERSTFGRRLAERKWVTSVEMTPPRGYDLNPLIAKCRRLKELGANCINIPDGPRASSRVSAMVTADKIQAEAGIETILHFCCRDRNLIGMQSDMLGCAACGIRNILFITGDPPKLGDFPYATGVFDTDSVGAVKILRRLNQGIDLSGAKIPEQTRIVMGTGLDPTALDRNREVDRFFKKVEAGAEFAITQPVFNPETLLEILEQVKGANIPILAGVWPLASYKNAYFMQTEVPGVNIPDSIMERMGQPETKEAQIAMGIEIAREAIQEIHNSIAGIQVSAPFGNIDIVARVLDGFVE